jgi:hypothetical protein
METLLHCRYLHNTSVACRSCNHDVLHVLDARTCVQPLAWHQLSATMNKQALL